MKHMLLGKVVTIVAVALVVMTFSGGIALSGSRIDEKAKLDLTSTAIYRHFEGDGELQLQIGAQEDISFQAKAKVKKGAIEHILYSMWLADQDGHIVFLDADLAHEKCVFDPITHKLKCKVRASLRADFGYAPFNVTTLRGLTIIIREHFGSFAPVVLIGTVTQSDLD